MSEFNLLQDTDLLGIIVNRQGAHNNHENYVNLFKLAGINKEWRRVVAGAVAGPLTEDAAKFMSNIALLYQSGDFAVIVRGLCYFQYMKQSPLQLYGITAIHVACTTGRHLHDTRVLKESAKAGGVEAVVGAMVMNPSSLSLNIVCTRMLAMYALYRPPNSSWGGWTDRRGKTGVNAVLNAMKRFPNSLDMQRCGMAGLVGMCKTILISVSVFRTAPCTTCKHSILLMGGLQVALEAMRVHFDADLHVDICKLFTEFHQNALSWQHMVGVQNVGNVHVIVEALRHNVAGMNHRATRRICKLLLGLANETLFMEQLLTIVEIPGVLVDILRQVVATIHTETPQEAIKNHQTTLSVTCLLKRFFLLQNHPFIRRFVLVPQSIAAFLQILQYYHDITISPPSSLFTRSKHIDHKQCLRVQENVCTCLLDLTFVDNFAENAVQAGAVPLMLNVIVEMENPRVRRIACRALANVIANDNDERSLFLYAGGLQKFATMMRALPSTDRESLFSGCDLLLQLVEFPNYRTAMLQVGFLEITNTHVQALEAQNRHTVGCGRLHDRLQVHAAAV